MADFKLKNPAAPATAAQLGKLRSLGADTTRRKWTMQEASDEINARLNGPEAARAAPAPDTAVKGRVLPNPQSAAPQQPQRLPSSSRELVDQARKDAAAKDQAKRREIFASVALKASVEFYNGKDRPPIEVDATARHFMELLLEMSA